MNAARTLIRGATVITMDAQGELPRGDVLVTGDTITEIAPILHVDDAQVVDASGCIVIPGLVNAHMHTWQTALRGLAANWTLLEYFQKMHAGLATVFEPEDLYIATLVGALNQLNCGSTTLADWCHNNKTPAHNDAAIQGLLESGIRAAFFHGTPKPDPKPGERPFWEVPHPRAEVERLLKAHQGKRAAERARRRAGAALLHAGRGAARFPHGPGAGPDRLAAPGRRARRARPTAGTSSKRPACWGRRSTSCTAMRSSDDQLKRFCELGMSFSAAAENEMTQGHGHPITGRLRALGKAPSLGVDLESVLSGDMLTQARVALGMQRSLDNVAYRERHGTIPPTSTISTREALSWVTVEGARMLGQLDRIGTLAAGQAGRPGADPRRRAQHAAGA